MGIGSSKTQKDKLHHYTVLARLDDEVPLYTKEWQNVEQILNQISEFVPISMLNSLTEHIVAFADDQARRGYVLGQEDLVKELRGKRPKS